MRSRSIGSPRRFKTYKKIALEEHVMVPNQVYYNGKNPYEFDYLKKELSDVVGKRLRLMDRHGIQMMVLSVTAPGLQGMKDEKTMVQNSQKWNNWLASAIKRHPRRFRAFASLPMRYPKEAAKELVRAVKDLGMVGPLVNGWDDTGGKERVWYGEPSFDVFWQTLVDLDVPLYLHPRTYYAKTSTYTHFPELAGSGWGFSLGIAEQVLRLIYSGLFDRFPKLKIILGHMGEMVVFWAARLDQRHRREGFMYKKHYKKSITAYLRQNFYVTTSGFFYTPAFDHVIAVMGPKRVMFSMDYPMESMEEAVRWFDGMKMKRKEREDVEYRNARRLLHLK